MSYRPNQSRQQPNGTVPVPRYPTPQRASTSASSAPQIALPPPPFRSVTDVAQLSDAEILRLGDQYYIELLERRRRAEQAAIREAEKANSKGRKGSSKTKTNGSSRPSSTSYYNGQSSTASRSMGPPPVVPYGGPISNATPQTSAARRTYPNPLATAPTMTSSYSTNYPNPLAMSPTMTPSYSTNTLYETSSADLNASKLPNLPPLVFAPLAAEPVRPKPRDCKACCAKGCCCFCLYSPGAKWGMFACIVALAVGIGVALFFCWPRLPNSSNVYVGTVSVVPGTADFKLRSAPAARVLDPAFSADIVVPITIYSPMMIPITLQSISLNLTYSPPSGNRYPLATGLYPNPSFGPQQNTTVLFPLKVSYNSSTGLTDPVVQGLIEDCGFLADSGPTSIPMDYVAVATLLPPFNAIRPTFSNKVDVAVCPILAQAVIGVVRSLFEQLPAYVRLFVSGSLPEDDADPSAALRKYISLMQSGADTVGVSTEGTVLEVVARLLDWAGINVADVTSG